jgi:hypothetical protein
VETQLLRVSCWECESKENTYGVTTSSSFVFCDELFHISNFSLHENKSGYIYIYIERREKNESLLGSHGAKRAAHGPLLQNLN